MGTDSRPGESRVRSLVVATSCPGGWLSEDRRARCRGSRVQAPGHDRLLEATKVKLAPPLEPPGKVGAGGGTRRRADQRFVWSRLARKPCCNIDGAPIPVPSAHHRRSRVDPDSHRQEIAPSSHVVQGVGGERESPGGFRDPDHHAVTHRFDLPGAVLAAHGAHRPLEFGGDASSGTIAVCLCQCGVPDEVDEHEGRRRMAAHPSPATRCQQIANPRPVEPTPFDDAGDVHVLSRGCRGPSGWDAAACAAASPPPTARRRDR